MFKAILLDLDGTLLDIDMDTFIPPYVRRLVPFAEPYVDPQRFPEFLMRATALTEHDQAADLCNFDTWMNYFFDLASVSNQEALLKTLERFYRDEFPRLRHLANPVPQAPELVGYCLDRGMDVVVATNPIFPEVAVRERMRWAGVAEYPFTLVTTMENMHYCKPYQGYYNEILNTIQRQPEECLMVGDDVVRDLGARRYGIKTFWVHPGPDAPVPEPGCDYRGNLDDLFRRLRQDDWT